MCGLTGAISQWLSSQEVDLFRELMVVSSLRGTQGAGITFVPDAKKKRVEMLRYQGSAATLANHTSVDKSLKKVGRCSVLMGHARQPTRGGNTDADLHPHNVGSVVGMHNGTMQDVMGQKVEKNQNDSRLLFTAIEKHGLYETVDKSTGDMALSWINLNDGTLNFFRNTKRELWLAHPDRDYSTIFWASEAGMLDFVLNRHYEQPVKVYELKPFFHLKFKMRPSNGNVTPTSYEQLVFVKENGVPEADKERFQLAPTNVRFVTFRGETVLEPELVELLSEGCQNCEVPFVIRDYKENKIVWIDKGEFICKECIMTDPIAEKYARSVGYRGPGFTTKLRERERQQQTQMH